MSLKRYILAFFSGSITVICSIIKEEKQTKIKNTMLDYITDLIEDAQDFGWVAAKGAYDLILYRMEEGGSWSITEKTSGLRRACAQKILTNSANPQIKKVGDT